MRSKTFVLRTPSVPPQMMSLVSRRQRSCREVLLRFGWMLSPSSGRREKRKGEEEEVGIKLGCGRIIYDGRRQQRDS